MHKLFVQPENLRSDEYKQQLIHNSNVATQLIADISTQLTDKQRRHFNKRIDKYIRLINELAQEARPRQTGS